MRSWPNDSQARAIKGIGVGLRTVHYGHILEHRPSVPWFEVISENYMGIRGGAAGELPFQGGGRPLEILDQVAANYPITMHGVSMNIGSADPLRKDYLFKLKSLMRRLEPVFVSDHLCWTGVLGENLHDLLPLPYTEEVLHHIVPRIQYVQDFLGRRLLIENVSSYLSFNHSEMTEWEFLSELSLRADCDLLLDVNNIYVSSQNHRFDPVQYLAGIPIGRVKEMHLAGYSEEENVLIDTHDHPVTDPVWSLYHEAIKLFGAVPTLIEWDDKIPAFDVLEAEATKAQQIQNAVKDERELAYA